MRHRLIKSETYLVSKKKKKKIQTNKNRHNPCTRERQIIVILEILVLYTKEMKNIIDITCPQGRR